jgi:hypothetical protein
MSTEECKLCAKEAKLICKCAQVYLCEQCVGQHLLQNFTAKHRPMRLIDYLSSIAPPAVELTEKPELKSAILSKLNNEVLEIEEFRKISLQKISEVVQMAEKELLETVEQLMNEVSDNCESAQRDLKCSAATLKLPEYNSNYILSLFGSCKSVEEVRDLQIVHKLLDLDYLSMAQFIHESVNFSLQITNEPRIVQPKSPSKLVLNKETVDLKSNVFDFTGKRRGTALNIDPDCLDLESPEKEAATRHRSTSNDQIKLSSPKDENLNRSLISFFHKASTMRPESPFASFANRPATPKLQTGLDIEMRMKEPAPKLAETNSQTLSATKGAPLLRPHLAYFFPSSNRFLVFNMSELSCTTVELPRKLFLKESSWSICEGGRLIQTGGFDTRARNEVLNCKLADFSVEKCQSMLNKRHRHSQVSLGGYVYAIGGMNGSALKSVERLNLMNFKWTKVGPLNIARSEFAACAHSGKVYVAGGNETKSFEVFNTLTKKFSILPVLLPRCGKLCMFGYDDKVIILQKDELLEGNLQGGMIVKMGRIEEKEWKTEGDYCAVNNEIYFMCEGFIHKFEVDNRRLMPVKAIDT